MSGGREHELICHGAFNTVVATFPNRGSYLTAACNGFGTANSGVVKGVRAARLGEWLEGVLHESSGAPGTGIVDDLAKIQDEMVRKCAELVCVRDQMPSDAKPYERVRATQIFATLREFVIDHLKVHEEIPTLALVVEKLGVSIRTLEYTCKSLLNVSPQRYLTCWRLHCARRDIRAHAGSSSVTDIALKWGFSHLGRFSIAYRELFGEVPSSTLTTSRIAVAMR
jgi:AraC-like DNA-binding protein